jgi:hypothetical protein
MLFREERVALIRERLLQHRPEFVVFYSPDNGPDRRYAAAWNAIEGTPLTQ